MIDPALVSAVLVTRGNVPMTAIFDSLLDAGITARETMLRRVKELA